MRQVVYKLKWAVTNSHLKHVALHAGDIVVCSQSNLCLQILMNI